jgi:hypothetical protein
MRPFDRRLRPPTPNASFADPSPVAPLLRCTRAHDLGVIGAERLPAEELIQLLEGRVRQPRAQSMRLSGRRTGDDYPIRQFNANRGG